jgi:phosphoribosylcarboxyaminoimidazole (NCAIR) mutase
MTPLPVIGVPVKPAGAHLDGMDALLSIVQMPKGVPVSAHVSVACCMRHAQLLPAFAEWAGGWLKSLGLATSSQLQATIPSPHPLCVQVATVAIGNAANAGLLAVRIIAAHTPALLDKMVAYQEGMRKTVEAKAHRLELEGWQEYKQV